MVNASKDKYVKRSNHMENTNSEKYSRGRRGAPAKGVGRATGARVQIPPAPLTERKRQSEYSGCLFSFYYYDMQKTMSTSYSQYLQSYKGNVEYDRETEND